MRTRLEAVIDVSLDKTALLCGDTLPSSCPTQTPDGHPFSIDQHHLTFEFAQWIGVKLSNDHPPWLEGPAGAEPQSDPVRQAAAVNTDDNDHSDTEHDHTDPSAYDVTDSVTCIFAVYLDATTYAGGETLAYQGLAHTAK
jgi:hypothetical protein